MPAGGSNRADLLSVEEFVGLEIDQVRQLKQLQEENGKLKKVVAELSLDKAVVQDVVSKKF